MRGFLDTGYIHTYLSWILNSSISGFAQPCEIQTSNVSMTQ